MAEQTLEVVVGTYEEFILGYKLLGTEHGRELRELKNTFANHNHIGSVRSLACRGRFLASGGTDETIYLFNMNKRQDLGSLKQQEGTITCLEFNKDATHLFSGSEDGTIAVFSTSNWECLKVLRGHKKGVTCISVHPTGGLLLSASQDKTLRTWNLIKGRSAYIVNLKAVAEIVQWSYMGDFFIVGTGTKLDVYSVETAGVIHSIDYGRRITCACFIFNDTVVIGGEDGRLEIHDFEKKSLITAVKAHSNRIKAVSRPFCGLDETVRIVSISSDGYIKIWDFTEHKLYESPSLIGEINTTCRPTCLALSVMEA